VHYGTAADPSRPGLGRSRRRGGGRDRVRVVKDLPRYRILLLCVACSATPSTDEAVVLYYGMRARAFVATPDEARAGMLAAFEALDYTLLDGGADLLVARSPGSTRFFAFVGEQTKWHEVTAMFAPVPGGRVRIDLDAVLVHGPARGATRAQVPEADAELYEELFELIHAVLRARTGL